MLWASATQVGRLRSSMTEHREPREKEDEAGGMARARARKGEMG